MSAAQGEATWWSRLTYAVASQLDEQRVARLGAAVDRALPALPAPVGRKAVALVVESAGHAGFEKARP